MSSGVGDRIKIARQKEGLTQAEMAEILDIPKITLQNYERGTRTISEANLLKITNHPRFRKYALWLVTDDLDDSGQESVSASSDEFAKLLETLSDDEVAQVIQYMEFLLAKRK